MLLGLLGRKRTTEYVKTEPKAVAVKQGQSSMPCSRIAPPPARERISRNPIASATSFAAMGVVIKDSKEGTTWEIAR